MSASSQPAPGGLVPIGAAIRAEMARAKGSASARFAAFGLLIAVLQGVGWFTVATGPMRDWLGLLGWQSLYATGLFAPVVALLAATTTAREARAREGGTWARPLAPRTSVVARLVVLAWQSLLLQASLTLPMLGFGLAGGLTNAPVGRFVAMWLVLWATSLLPLTIGYVLSRRIGLIATVGLALVWQIVGAVRAETATWWAEPWTWSVRAMLPILGIHQNGVRLVADSPIWSWNPIWPVLLTLVTGLLVAALAAWRARVDATPSLGLAGLLRRRTRINSTPSGSGHAPSPARPARPDLLGTGTSEGTSSDASVVPVVIGRPRPFAAQAIVLRATAIPALVAAALLVLALVAVLWTSGYVTGMATWLIVPLGACILACLVWSANADGWRIAALRLPVAASARSMSVWCLGLLALVVAAATVFAQVSRGSGVPAMFAVLLFATGAMTLAVSLALATRCGTGAALGVTLVVLVFSLVFGSTWIAETNAWIAGVYGWPLTASSDPTRTAIALTISVVVTCVALAAWLRAIRRAAT